MKDPDKVRLPGSDLCPVVLCLEVSNNHVSSALLDDLPLDLGHGSEVASRMSSSCSKCSTLLVQLTSSVA